MSQINLNANSNPISYLNGVGETEAGQKAKGANNTPPFLPKESTDDNQVYNRGFKPDTPPTNADLNDLKGILTASLSPGAMLAALCVKEAAQQNEQNTKEIFKRNEAVVKDMNNQADKIKDAAWTQMWLSISGSVLSGIGSVAGAVVTAKGGGGDDLIIAKAKGEAISGVGGSLGGIFNSIGGYISSKSQAEVKKLDADIESNRTAMEAMRNSMQAQRDLLTKSLEFMSSMQSSMNQTLARIVG